MSAKHSPKLTPLDRVLLDVIRQRHPERRWRIGVVKPSDRKPRDSRPVSERDT